MATSRYNNDTVVNNKYTTHKFNENKQTQCWTISSYKGMRLDMLADKYYKNPTLWYVIAKYNNLNIDSLILNGEQGILRIPKKLYDYEVK